MSTQNTMPSCFSPDELESRMLDPGLPDGRLLRWYDKLGYGFFPADPSGMYGQAYHDQYVSWADTDMGHQLTALRVAMVNRHIGNKPLVDVGAGSGQFVRARPNTMAYEVNPAAVKALRAENLHVGVPFAESFPHASFWDSLEHMPDMVPMLRQRTWIFLSMPIYTGPEEVLASKHFKPREHYWYFTEGGLVGYLGRLSFELAESNQQETLAGRESIGSFAFKRHA